MTQIFQGAQQLAFGIPRIGYIIQIMFCCQKIARSQIPTDNSREILISCIFSRGWVSLSFHHGPAVLQKKTYPTVTEPGLDVYFGEGHRQDPRELPAVERRSGSGRLEDHVWRQRHRHRELGSWMK